MAELHSQLQADCRMVGRFPLCHLLLMNDANYPWFILVPDRDNVREIYQLSDKDQVALIRESSHLAGQLSVVFKADKINIAALGNVVPQLHIHHIVRYVDDAAWPAPVWGRFPTRQYAPDEMEDLIARLSPALTERFQFCR
jgi:diadenosine tetraphosphate (Ap4A) HIT family hydrolase